MLNIVYLNILATAATREAPSSVLMLEACTKINQKIKTPTGKQENPTGNGDKDYQKNRIDQLVILCDDDDDVDDENMTKPKLEKRIKQDKGCVEQERKQKNDEKNTENDNAKFKMFVSADVPTKSPEKQKTNPAEDDDDDIIEVKELSPVKIDLTEPSSPQESPPPPFKPRNKHPTSLEGGGVKKRLKRSESVEGNATNNNTDQLLKGVVFAISGCQMNNSRSRFFTTSF